MKKICVYGKGGIGKSTTVANVAAVMAHMGKQVAVVGCDPKADTTRCLMGRRIPTVLDQQRISQGAQIAFTGYQDILCMESGGPEPGTGCAGRGIVAALREIQSRDLFDTREVVLYDVLGDVVCGGFSMPLREEIADEVYLVTTADFMALYAANNICRGILKYAVSGSVRLAGIIYNERSGIQQRERVERFAERIGTRIVGCIPMSQEIALAESRRKTVIQEYPDSPAAAAFAGLAEAMLGPAQLCIPQPLCEEELEELCMQTTGGNE